MYNGLLKEDDNMYELKKVGNKTYYMECPSKVGFYLLNDKDVCVIDTGNDRDYGKIILKIIEENNWNLKMIINTHSHADHIGGNSYLEKHTKCSSYVSGLENVMTHNPIISPMMLYGANPLAELKSKFVVAEKTNTKDISELDGEFEIIDLPGHTTNQIGIKTSDGVWFIGDALVGEHVINKYKITYMYDIGKHMETLEKLESLEGSMFIASHAEATDDIHSLIKLNRDNILEIIEYIKSICNEEITFECIVKKVFDNYNMRMDLYQNMVIGSTIKSILTYMREIELIDFEIKDNMMIWKTI